jgi:RNA polymerase sigma factor (TIGR02999 family)
MNIPTDVTQMLNALERGEKGATDQLFALVYDNLRRMAKQKVSHEPAGITLDATGLVHEVYMRLFQSAGEIRWENRRHFFGAAAEAMRRILIDHARKRSRLKRGGDQVRVDLLDIACVGDNPELLLQIDDCLDRLKEEDPPAYELARLRLFAGLTVDSAAEILGCSRATAYRHWTYARAWLQTELLSD